MNNVSVKNFSVKNPSVKNVVVLGSTGSVGTNTLEVIAASHGRLCVYALSAHANLKLMLEQAQRFHPRWVIATDVQIADDFDWSGLPDGTELLLGQEGVQRAVSVDEVDVAVVAIVGSAGLAGTWAALEAGKTVALANKETLVVAGALVKALLAQHGSTLIPVDSEHSAIFQCLVGEPARAVESLVLTASGGPFRTRPAETFAQITRDEALRHPNWSMGAKITIDSATMMNKGLEVIEAYWLFGVQAEQIEVLIHPQSIIHSMVTFTDGSTKAQLGVPDMKVPIQYALSYPDRWPAPHPRIDWSRLKGLDFEPPDVDKFPCLRLAYEALAFGGTAPAVLNAANEQAVALFLKDHIRFVDIPRVVEAALGKLARTVQPSYETLVEADAEARRLVLEHGRGIPD